MKYQTNKDLAMAQRYLKMLDDFCKTGETVLPEPPRETMPWNTEEDPLQDYLVYLFRLPYNVVYGTTDPKFPLQVKNSRLKGKVFYDAVGKFVVECVHQQRFQQQRAWTENRRADEVLDWPLFRRMDRGVWEPLLDQLHADHQDDGFDRAFFLRLLEGNGAADEHVWLRLVHDWKACIRRQVLTKVKGFIAMRAPNFEQGLVKTMDQVTRTMKTRDVPEARAVQAWELMTGGWTETEFERCLNRMKLQDQYPDIQEIVARMGRVADADGKDRLTVASGVEMKMEHSSGSDIEGITVGDDLNALLPLELAQYSDDDMQGLFIYKYRTRRLQTFRYKSEMSKPSRKLGYTRASRKGPMIVCLDTSASMYGIPERISSTILSLIEESAEELERDCYLIDFSVNIRPIDLMARRQGERMRRLGLQVGGEEGDGMQTPVRRQPSTTHLPFIGGSTNARKMMTAMFELLDNDGMRYVNADVLWITDFMIADPPQTLLDRVKEYRETGTRFYGVRIVRSDDKEDNPWEPYFNKIYTLRYRQLRRY